MITKFIYGNLTISFQKNDYGFIQIFKYLLKNLCKPIRLLEKYNLLIWTYANCCFVAKEKALRESCWKFGLSMLSKWCNLYSEPAISLCTREIRRVKNVHPSNFYNGKMATAQMSIDS